MRQGDWPLAKRYSQQALIANPGDAEFMIDAAKIAALNDQKREAAQLLVDAVTLTHYQPASRVDFAVQALIDVGEVYEAIDLLERSLHQHPDNVKQRRALVSFLGETQRTELIAPHFEKLIRARSFDVHLLEAVTDASSRRFSHNTDDRLLKRNPDDRRVRLGEAHRDAEPARRSSSRRDPGRHFEASPKLRARSRHVRPGVDGTAKTWKRFPSGSRTRRQRVTNMRIIG